MIDLLSAENPLKLVETLQLDNKAIRHYRAKDKKKSFYYQDMNVALGTGNGLISADKGVAQQIFVYLKKYTLKYDLASIQYKKIDPKLFTIPDYFTRQQFQVPK